MEIEKDSNPVDEIDLKEIIITLWNSRLLISLVMGATTLFGLLLALWLPNIYKSEALLAPVQAENSLNRTMQSYSGLASLAGINLPSSSSVSQTTEAIEKLQSFSFFKDQVLMNIFLPDLMAIDSWDASLNTISYDSSQYNFDSSTWVRKVKLPKLPEPSAQESFKEFQEIFQISEDKDTGFIKISIYHQSPHVAKNWVELIIHKINESLRAQKKLEAEKAIEYLNLQMAQSNFAEIKQALSELIKNQIQQLTLVEANEEYVFKYIDPPIVEEEKVKPRRILIVVFAVLIGFISACLYILIRYFRKKV